MLDMNVLEIREGMPIKVLFVDNDDNRSEVELFISDYTDRYDSMGIEDDGVPSQITAQEYSKGGGYDNTNYITEWVIDIPEHKLMRKYARRKNEETKNYENSYELEDVIFL